MKKIILLLVALFAAFLMISCDDDGGETTKSDSDAVETPDTDEIDNMDDTDEIDDMDEINDMDETPDTDTPEKECTGISVVDFTAGGYPNSYYNTSIELGGSGADQLGVSFYDFNEDNETGNSGPATYDLTSSINNNFGTCLQCVLAYEDIDEDTGYATRMYFQESGSLTVTKGIGEEGTSKGTITSVKLIEVTIDEETFESTPVAGGECIIIESGSWTSDQCETDDDCESSVCDTTGDINVCVECIESSDCSANTEGKNVCSASNTCVECNENSDCATDKLCISEKNICSECITDSDCSENADGKTTCDNVKTYACVDGNVTCIDISEDDLNSIDITYDTDDLIYSGIIPALGEDADDDYVTLEFYAATPAASYDLASEGVNDNYKTCMQCVLLRENYVSEENIGRIFFQTAGSLEVTSGDPSSSANTSGTVSNLTVKEVVIDADYTSTVVPGGACFNISSKDWDTTSAE